MMTDAEVATQIERANRFIADLRELVAATAVDPASPCADETRAGLKRIAATLDAVLSDDVIWEHRHGDVRRAAGRDRGQPDVRRRRPDAGLCRRGGVPRRVPAGDRHGAGAAAQFAELRPMGGATELTLKEGPLLIHQEIRRSNCAP